MDDFKEIPPKLQDGIFKKLFSQLEVENLNEAELEEYEECGLCY